MDGFIFILDLHQDKYIDWLSHGDQDECKRLTILEASGFDKFDQSKNSLIVINSETRFMRLEVPLVNKYQLKKIIPHLVEDITLGNLIDYHLAITKRDKDGFLLVSITPKSSIEKSVSIMRAASINLESIIPIESLISRDEGEGFLVSCDDICFINLGNKWRWSSDEGTITSLLEEGLIEFNISKMSLYHDGRLKEDVGGKSIKIKSLVDFINLNTHKFSLELDLLKGEFKPKIIWSKLFKRWYVVILLIFIIFFMQILSMTFTAYKNQYAANDLNKLSVSSYKTLYPNEPLSKDITRQIKKKLRNITNQGTEKFIETFLSSSEILANNQNASIFSINFDKENNLFLLEVESSEFEDLEEIKNKLIEHGYIIEAGASRRSGASIISEISIRSE